MILRLISGILLGVFFYGGLWLTVRSLRTTRHPLALTLASLVLRTLITVAGFYWLIGARWQNAAVALVGFAAVRFLLPRERSALCT